MKIQNLIKIGLCVCLGCALFACSDSKDSKSEQGDNLELLRSGSVENENAKLPEVDWNAKAAGESEKIERAFENAPPMIPHDITGMSIITQDNNACIACHDPSVASAVNATPVPASHMYDLVKNKPTKNISPARYNCTQCHVPQANITVEIQNTFNPEFSNENMKNKSNLLETINEGTQVK